MVLPPHTNAAVVDTGFAAIAAKQTCPQILQTVALSTHTTGASTAPSTRHALLLEVAGLGYARHELHGFGVLRHDPWY